MKTRHSFLFQFAILATAACASPCTFAQTSSPLIATITVPGLPLEAFDIGWVDPTTQIYYFSDRSNKAVDSSMQRRTFFLDRSRDSPGPRRPLTAGPNGVVVLSELKQVWASNGDSYPSLGKGTKGYCKCRAPGPFFALRDESAYAIAGSARLSSLHCIDDHGAIRLTHFIEPIQSKKLGDRDTLVGVVPDL